MPPIRIDYGVPGLTRSARIWPRLFLEKNTNCRANAWRSKRRGQAPDPESGRRSQRDKDQMSGLKQRLFLLALIALSSFVYQQAQTKVSQPAQQAAQPSVYETRADHDP